VFCTSLIISTHSQTPRHLYLKLAPGFLGGYMTVPMKCGPIYFTLIYFCYMLLFSVWSYFFSPASIISPSPMLLLYICQCYVIWECESVWKFNTCSTHSPITWPHISSLVYVQTASPPRPCQMHSITNFIGLPTQLPVHHSSCPYLYSISCGHQYSSLTMGPWR
jgi:hypothetical protein